METAIMMCDYSTAEVSLINFYFKFLCLQVIQIGSGFFSTRAHCGLTKLRLG